MFFNYNLFLSDLGDSEQPEHAGQMKHTEKTGKILIGNEAGNIFWFHDKYENEDIFGKSA